MTTISPPSEYAVDDDGDRYRRVYGRVECSRGRFATVTVLAFGKIEPGAAHWRWAVYAVAADVSSLPVAMESRGRTFYVGAVAYVRMCDAVSAALDIAAARIGRAA